MSIEDRYRHDGVFNRVVDQLRALLRMYQITPSELREASMLAAVMHESEYGYPIRYVNNAMVGMKTNQWDGKYNTHPVQWAQWNYNYPYMFGGEPSSKPSVSNPPKPVLTCICAVKEEKIHTATCNHYNWEYWHPKSIASVPLADPNLHCHVFYYSGKSQGYSVCDCGISETYYNWAYPEKKS